MGTEITFPIQAYNALLGRCLRTSREYALLRNGIISRRIGDRHQAGIIQVLCDPKEAELIFALAAKFYPSAVSQISKKARLDGDGGASSAMPQQSEHLLQIYETEARFLDTLASFAAAGLLAGQAVVAIATATHLEATETRLRKHDIDVNQARRNGAYIPLEADSVLRKLLVDGWPSEELFETVIGGILARARAGGRNVRAFGEMVALLWEHGERPAALRLEALWEHLRKRESFSLFCAYPRATFTCENVDYVAEVCAAHSRIISCDL